MDKTIRVIEETEEYVKTNCKYLKIIKLLEKRIDTIVSLVIVSTSISLILFSLLFLICILLNC